MSEWGIEARRDHIEDAILLALHAYGSARPIRAEHRKDGFIFERSEMAFFCGPDMTPRSCYTFDLANVDERLFSLDWHDLVVDPIKAIGSRLEIMMLCDDGSLKWIGVIPMKQPRGLAAVTNMKPHWFTLHFRHIANDGRQKRYIKRPFCIAGGDLVMLKPLGWKGFQPERDRGEIRDQLMIVLSVFEDAHRSTAFLATVKESVEVVFPVGSDAYKDFFILRDGPNNTPTGRKNPILHFCSKHLRRAGSVKNIEVERHQRGTDTLHIGPMSLTIRPSDGYAQWLPDPAPPAPDDTPSRTHYASGLNSGSSQ